MFAETDWEEISLINKFTQFKSQESRVDAVHACDPSTWEAELGKPRVRGQPMFHHEILFQTKELKERLSMWLRRYLPLSGKT